MKQAAGAAIEFNRFIRSFMEMNTSTCEGVSPQAGAFSFSFSFSWYSIHVIFYSIDLSWIETFCMRCAHTDQGSLDHWLTFEFWEASQYNFDNVTLILQCRFVFLFCVFC